MDDTVQWCLYQTLRRNFSCGHLNLDEGWIGGAISQILKVEVEAVDALVVSFYTCITGQLIPI